MATFSATDAGLIGFKLAREKPLAVVAFALLDLISTALVLGVLVTLAGPALAEVQAAATSADPDPQALLQGYAKAAPAIALIIPLSIIFSGILYAGVSRLVLNPQDRGVFGWLKFGADEFRQMLVMILIGLVMAGGYFALALAIGVFTAVGAAIAPALGVLIAFLGVVAGICGLLFLAVRLSLASPITFATGRVSVRESWRMTQGHFWSLLGAYLLAVVLGMIVAVLMMAIFFAVGSLTMGLAATAKVIMDPDMTSLATLLTPAAILYYLFNAAVSGLTTLIFFGPAPTIYKDLKGEPDVFD